MNIELDYDTVGNIVAKDLQQSIRMTLEDPYELYHDYDQAYALVDSMLEVLEYYMVIEEFEEFVDTLPERNYGQTEETSNSFEIIDIVENPDGSANITYEIAEEDKQEFVNSGISYALLKLALGNPTDDEIYLWALSGKEASK